MNRRIDGQRGLGVGASRAGVEHVQQTKTENPPATGAFHRRGLAN